MRRHLMHMYACPAFTVLAWRSLLNNAFWAWSPPAAASQCDERCWFFDFTWIDASKEAPCYTIGPVCSRVSDEVTAKQMQMKARHQPRKLWQDEKCQKTMVQIEALMMRYQSLVRVLDCAAARLLICTQAGGSLHSRFKKDFGPHSEMCVTFD